MLPQKHSTSTERQQTASGMMEQVDKKLAARVILTSQCTRNCRGCANRYWLPFAKTIESAGELLRFERVAFTGGDIAICPERTKVWVENTRKLTHATIYAYITRMNPCLAYLINSQHIDGLTYTLHYPYREEEWNGLQWLRLIWNTPEILGHGVRLVYDPRMSDLATVANRMLPGIETKELIWLPPEECEPPETLFVTREALNDLDPPASVVSLSHARES